MGRPRIPNELHRLHGNPGDKPRSKLRVLKTPAEIGGAPTWMTKTQREAWRHAVTNAPIGLLRSSDRAALTAFIVAENLHQLAAGKIAADGLTVMNGSQEIPNPAISIVSKQALLMLKAAAELGFTPASRARLVDRGVDEPSDDVTRQNGTGDELDRLLEQRPRIN
jgi:P27 family predicted phage terminase small subunit